MELLVLPGDGIGPEITDATLTVLVRDLGGPLGTRAFAERVAGHLA
jgi:isocitrate/isopropylmalate dehydrogenase